MLLKQIDMKQQLRNNQWAISKFQCPVRYISPFTFQLLCYQKSRRCCVGKTLQKTQKGQMPKYPMLPPSQNLVYNWLTNIALDIFSSLNLKLDLVGHALIFISLFGYNKTTTSLPEWYCWRGISGHRFIKFSRRVPFGIRFIPIKTVHLQNLADTPDW